MTEFNTGHITGRRTGKHGIERSMFEHAHDPSLLVGIEHAYRYPEELKLYNLTGNILYAIFPQNFPKIVKAGTDEATDKSYSVVRKIKGKEGWQPGEYKVVEKSFIDTIGKVVPENRKNELEGCFDFKNGPENILIDEHGNPVYVDKVSRWILDLIDPSLLESFVVNPRKIDILKRVIQKTLVLHHEWIKKSAEIYSLMKKLNAF